MSSYDKSYTSSSLYDSTVDSQHRSAVRPDPNLPVLVLTPAEYERFRSFVLDRTGLDFTEDKAAQLVKDFAEWMQQHKDELMALQIFYNQPYRRRPRRTRRSP